MHMRTTAVRSTQAWFITGLLLVSLLVLPTLVLNGKSSITIHDQLDGEVPAYVLRSKHLSDPSLPEFIGLPDNKASLTPPSFGTLLFYLLFTPPTAFTLNVIFIQFFAFIGLFLLLREWDVDPWICFVSAILFCLLPFYSVYGLSVMGQPFLLFACIRAIKGDRYWPYLISGVFALFSSLVLVGFVDCGLLLIAFLLLLGKKKDHAYTLLKILLVLVAVYGCFNFNLIRQVLGSTSFTSHRTEWVVTTSKTWWRMFISLFSTGSYHAASDQMLIVPVALMICFIGLLRIRLAGSKTRTHIMLLVIMLGVCTLIAAFYATWNCAFAVKIRNQLGGLFISFNIDRFFWLYPCLWYSALGLTLQLICHPEEIKLNSIPLIRNIDIKRIIVIPLVAVFILSLALLSFHKGHLQTNMRRFFGEYTTLDTSFDHFYSTSLFDEIDAYIGRPKSDYKVGSVALYPSVPLFNGFYCIDGYSNNYDVEYKHRFRQVIAAELEKDDSIREYFDNWGSRCYLFSSEAGKNYYYLKNNPLTIRNLQLNHDALVELGCEYIFSGLEIENPEDSGLVFLKSFENDDSPYRIWVYRV